MTLRFIVPAISLIGLAASCGHEPCLHSRDVTAGPELTPFSGGKTVFDACEQCPELPADVGVPEAVGPATVCEVGFRDESERADVLCLYGPNGNTSSSIANGAVTNIRNAFEFCEAHCPSEDYLHGCDLTGDADGTLSLSCHYGEACD